MQGDDIYVFVEGDADSRLFDAVIKPQLDSKFSINLRPYPYSNRRQPAKKLIQELNRLNRPYIFTRDKEQSDADDGLLKDKTYREYGLKDKSCVHLVVIEIESWYIAGITEEVRKSVSKDGYLPVSKWRNPESVDKDYFEAVAYANRMFSRIELETVCLDSYDLELAVSRSNSLRQFMSFSHI